MQKIAGETYTLSDDELLTVARRFGLAPGTMKNRVFAYLQRGLSRRDIRFLLRSRGNPATLAGTIRAYERAWQERQTAGRDA